MPDFNIDRIIEICSQSIIFKNMDKKFLKGFYYHHPIELCSLKKGS